MIKNSVNNNKLVNAYKIKIIIFSRGQEDKKFQKMLNV